MSLELLDHQIGSSIYKVPDLIWNIINQLKAHGRGHVQDQSHLLTPLVPAPVGFQIEKRGNPIRGITRVHTGRANGSGICVSGWWRAAQVWVLLCYPEAVRVRDMRCGDMPGPCWVPPALYRGGRGPGGAVLLPLWGPGV